MFKKKSENIVSKTLDTKDEAIAKDKRNCGDDEFKVSFLKKFFDRIRKIRKDKKKEKKPIKITKKGRKIIKNKWLGRKMTSFPRKIIISSYLIAILVLFYLVVITSIAPKSIPFVTNKIQTALQNRIGPATSIQNSFISFTSTGHLEVSVIGLKLHHKVEGSFERKPFFVPRIDAKFSLLQLILQDFIPRRVKISGINLVFDNLKKVEGETQNFSSHETMVINALSAIKSGALPIRSFDLEDTVVLFEEGDVKTKIILRKSSVDTEVKNGRMRIKTNNRITLDESKNDLLLNADCQFSDFNGLKCDTSINNFDSSLVAAIHPSFKILSNIDAIFDVDAAFEISDRKLKNVTFKAETARGSFNFSNFFAERMYVRNFSVDGEYDHRLRTLNLSKIKTNFEDGDVLFESQNEGFFGFKENRFGKYRKKKSSAVEMPELEMTLLISDLRGTKFVVGGDDLALGEADLESGDRMDFYISLKNIEADDIGKFWPVNLAEKPRDWVMKHISNGNIKSSFVKFSLMKNDKVSRLISLDSQLSFSDLTLDYDKKFPKITKIDGLALFDKDSMQIKIVRGKVLNSQIQNGEVVIDSFSDDNLTLRISGSSAGKAIDSLRHVNKDSKFSQLASKYLNGNSNNNFVINIPLTQSASLKNSYILVTSKIENLQNPYSSGNVDINLEKKVGSEVFLGNIDLTNAKYGLGKIDIEKDVGVESALKFNLNFDKNNILRLSRISLKKSSMIGKKNVTSAIYADAVFDTNQMLLLEAKIRNRGFGNYGKNSYNISYSADQKESLAKVYLSGSRINLANFLDGKKDDDQKFSFGPLQNSAISVRLRRVDLLHRKYLRGFQLDINCIKNYCYKIKSKAGYSAQQFLEVSSNKMLKDDFSTISANFSDVGYIADALGISKVLGGGYLRINLRNSIKNGKNLFVGDAFVKDELTIYDNEAVKVLAKNSLFSKVKDKIFSSEKVVLTTTKADIELYGYDLTLKSLVANNYKIGFTAKGFINISDRSCNIEGKIIPGFLINNLFGIGKIPVLGAVVRGVLTGGEKEGGVFGIRYSYVKKKGDKEAKFDTSSLSSFVPTTIGNLFE